MKKIFPLLLFIGILFPASYAQQWIPFHPSGSKAPEVNVLTSTAQTVVFTVTLPGIYRTDTVIKGNSFSRLHIPGAHAVNAAGEPEIPVLTYRVAIPECDNVVVSYNVVSKQNLTSGWVYPVPEKVIEQNAQGYPVMVEQFAFNPAAYAIPRIIEPAATLFSSGSLRTQHYAEIIVNPIEFCPVKQQITVIDQIVVTLAFTDPQGDIRQNLGMFQKSAALAFINYEDDGRSALMYDKAFEKEGFTRGMVQWKEINQPNDARTITADYVMVCDSGFFNSPLARAEIQRLAEHRAWYNGFNVTILNIADILSDDVGFPYEGTPGNPTDTAYKKEQRLRTCLRYIYEGPNPLIPRANLKYVLLVGDVGLKPGDDGYPIQVMGVPTSWEYNIDMQIASDYYFSCITKNGSNYDNEGDFFIGRFCVAPNLTNGLEELHNMVEKTIYFESEQSFGNWRNEVHVFNGGMLTHDYWNVQFPAFLDTLIVPKVRHSANCFNLNYAAPALELMKKGSSLLIVNAHGEEEEWEQGLSATLLKDSLTNVSQTPFCFGFSCLLGAFHTHKSFAQQMTSYSPDKGFVAMFASSIPYPTDPIPIPLVVKDPPERNHEIVPYLIFKDHIHIAGELFRSSLSQNKFSQLLMAQFFNLLGDPALNVMAEGYQITKDVTVKCPSVITNKMRIRNGATLTVPRNCTLNFLQRGKLIIEEDGNLNILNNAQINGTNLADTVARIHVKGGGFTAGNGVSFKYLGAGILFENSQNENLGYPVYDENVVYNLNHVSFHSTPLIHRGTKLNVSNCSFIHSCVKSFLGVPYIDSCSFFYSTFLSDHTQTYPTPYFSLYTTVINTKFSGPVFVGYNQLLAIQLINSTFYELSNNNIKDYETGISLHTSGCSMLLRSGLIGGSPMFKNNVTNCGTGITLYNSVGDFKSNRIGNCGFGVKLFNNSYTSFGEDSIINILRSQRIISCSSYELYASANSFPIFFHYNEIVDNNNLGNSFNDPLIYWDLSNKVKILTQQNVNFNYWGDNFNKMEDLYPPNAFICDSIWNPNLSIEPFDSIYIFFQKGLLYFANEDYTNAESTFKELIETYPNSRFAIAALHELFALEHFTNHDFYSLNSYYTSFTPSDSNLFNTADFLATRCYVKERDWQPAVDWYEERIMNPPSYQDSVFAVIDLGDIHLMMEGDTLNGAKSGHFCHYRLPDIKPKTRMQYEENKSSLLATLPQYKTPKSEEKGEGRKEKGERKRGVLGECVPNPTHGNATISYELFTGGVVEIQLFNSIGQLVKSLPQGKQIEGNYKININFAGFLSGAYYCALFVNGKKADAKKIIINH